MRIDHASLMVSDVDAALAFYVGVLGLEEIPRPRTFTFPGAWLRIGDNQLHLIGEAEPGRTKATHPGYRANELATGYANHFGIVVDDLAATAEALHARGVELVGGPRPRGDGVLQAYVADPDGNVIELMQTGVPVTGDEPEVGVPKP
jgi:catechol 2,3-dioxygenase-like lactoylglutathione lyase family enzyme